MSLVGHGSSLWRAVEERIRPLVAVHRRFALAVLSLVCGAFYTARILGFRALNPTDVGWLRGDALTEYLGWTFMRQDPVTALPFTFTDRIGYPLTISTAHFDLVPGVAIGLLPLSRILPSEFQYLGLFRCLCAAALFYLGHEIARLFSESGVTALGAGVLFMSNSVFTHRVGMHTALTGQFLLVWVIYESVKWLAPSDPSLVDRESVGHGMVRVLALSVAALGVNPYLALMSMLLAAGYVAAAVLWDRQLMRRALLLAPSAAVASAAAAWFFGYWSPSEDSSGPGLGLYSANLNTFVNPVVFSRFVRAMPVAAPEQMDGAAYLGIGVIAALVVGGAMAFKSPELRARLRRLLPMYAAAAGAFVFSLSHRITLGSHVVAEIPLSTPVRNFLSMFRASGRFTWPLFYLLLVTAIACLGLLVPRRVQGLAAAGLALLQIVELAPLTSGVRVATAAWGPFVELQSDAFRRLGEAHRHLVVLPAWQCGLSKSPGGVMGYGTFGMLAAQQHMTINSYYSGRYSRRVLDFHCRTLPGELLARGPLVDSAYVVDPNYRAWFEARAAATHECGRRDGFDLCVRRGTLY
jgi:hypothetical protein